MSTYLKIVGILELIGYAIGIVLFAIYCAFTPLMVFGFIVYLVFGPALGILFICVSNLLNDGHISYVHYENKFNKLQKRIDNLKKSTDDVVVNIGPKSSDEDNDTNSSSTASGQNLLAVEGATIIVLSSVDDWKGITIPVGAIGKIVNINKDGIIARVNVDGCRVLASLSNDQFKVIDDRLG